MTDEDKKSDQGREDACRRDLQRAKRVVVKLGTNVVMHPSGEMALGRLYGIIEELIALIQEGRQVILVSSGAVGLGVGRTGMTADLLPRKQACASVGQVLLMAVYEQAFSRFQIPVAQLLLTEKDFTDRTSYLNLRNTFCELLNEGILPVVNENDPVSTSEIEVQSWKSALFGDNDKLSALVMSKIDAEVLLVLTDVDGVYAPPGPEKGGKLITLVESFGDELIGIDCGAGACGTGGMQTKLEAMRISTESGGIGVIANGTRPGVIRRVLGGEAAGTLFVPRRRLSGRKRWIAFASDTNGKVVVTAGAREALKKRGASLLFAGIVRIEGDFLRGDVVAVADENNRIFARGMANHPGDVARGLIGKHTKDVVDLTHEPNFDSFITRDNLTLT